MRQVFAKLSHSQWMGLDPQGTNKTPGLHRGRRRDSEGDKRETDKTKEGGRMGRESDRQSSSEVGGCLDR